MLQWLRDWLWSSYSLTREVDALSLRLRVTEANLAALQARVNHLATLKSPGEIDLLTGISRPLETPS